MTRTDNDMAEGARILVVEDEPSLREVVGLYLSREGYEVELAADGREALAAFSARRPDLVVLDLMLPEVDGLSVTRTIRSAGDTPIIMVSARRNEADRILGFDLGADDYVVKPFSPQELVRRVRAVLRRAAPEPAAEAPALEFGDLRLDPRARELTVSGVPVSLTATEFDLLAELARHPRQVFTRDQLLERVWGVTEYIDPSTVTVHIRRIREKIEVDPSHPRHVATVWGVGYRFDP